MKQALAVLAWSAMLVVPTVASAQSAAGPVFLLGYGALTVAAIGRVIQGDGKADVRPGARIRVRFADTTLEGTVLSLTTDSMVVETATDTRLFATGDVNELGVSVGTRSQWAEGYFWGLALGGGGGALLGLAVGNDHGLFKANPEQQAVLFGVGWGVIGSLVGTAIGAATSREAWASARQPLVGVPLAVSPVLGRRRAGMALRFTL